MKWISVKDRLPEPSTEVLVYGQMHYVITHRPSIDICHLTDQNPDNNELQWSNEAGIRYKNVTHWMPLPELPS